MNPTQRLGVDPKQLIRSLQARGLVWFRANLRSRWQNAGAPTGPSESAANAGHKSHHDLRSARSHSGPSWTIAGCPTHPSSLLSKPARLTFGDRFVTAGGTWAVWPAAPLPEQLEQLLVGRTRQQ